MSGPVARGELGQVWRVETERGRWAVKEPFGPVSAAEVADDALYQEVVRAAGVPMPAIVRTADGGVITDVGSAVVRVYEWVDLHAADRWLDPRQVGRLAASIHRVAHHGDSPVHWWYTDPVGAAAWDDLVARLDVAGSPFADRLAGQRDELVALEALLEPPSRLQTCHRDLFADNVLRSVTGELSVIDWENSGLADPSQELAVVLVEFAGTDLVRASELYDAYVDHGGPGRIGTPGDFTMAIAQLGHLGELACRRWLEPGADRPRSAARIEEFLGEPLSRQLIAQMLDALRR